MPRSPAILLFLLDALEAGTSAAAQCPASHIFPPGLLIIHNKSPSPNKSLSLPSDAPGLRSLFPKVMATEDLPLKQGSREADELEKQGGSDETVVRNTNLTRKLLWKLDTR